MPVGVVLRMKNKHLILLLVICLTVTATAGIVLTKDITFDKVISDELKVMKIDNYNSIDKEQDGLYQRKLEKKECYNIPTQQYFFNESNEEVYSIWINITKCIPIISTTSPWFNNTEALDIWEKERLIQIANVSIIRKDRIGNTIIFNETKVTVKEVSKEIIK